MRISCIQINSIIWDVGSSWYSFPILIFDTLSIWMVTVTCAKPILSHITRLMKHVLITREQDLNIDSSVREIDTPYDSVYLFARQVQGWLVHDIGLWTGGLPERQTRCQEQREETCCIGKVDMDALPKIQTPDSLLAIEIGGGAKCLVLQTRVNRCELLFPDSTFMKREPNITCHFWYFEFTLNISLWIRRAKGLAYKFDLLRVIFLYSWSLSLSNIIYHVIWEDFLRGMCGATPILNPFNHHECSFRYSMSDTWS